MVGGSFRITTWVVGDSLGYDLGVSHGVLPLLEKLCFGRFRRTVGCLDLFIGVPEQRPA